MPDLDEMIDTRTAAAMVGVAPVTLQVWRSRGKGPRYFKLSGSKTGAVRYRRGEILRFLGASEVRP